MRDRRRGDIHPLLWRWTFRSMWRDVCRHCGRRYLKPGDPGIFAGRRCLPVGVGPCGEVRLVCRDAGAWGGFSDERKYL